MLLNYRADAEIVQRLLPAPLEVDKQHGHAIVGICLIRLENSLRPQGVPSVLGVSTENMAHRVAIQYPANGGLRPGVFIWRRETDQRLIQMLGGRHFPGVHHPADFQIVETHNRLAMDVISDDGQSDVHFSAYASEEWQPTPGFNSFNEVSDFFRKGDCGFLVLALRGDELEGLQLKTLKWNMVPMQVESHALACFIPTLQRSLEFDCGSTRIARAPTYRYPRTGSEFDAGVQP